jgi:hypothetical protein
MAAIASDLQRLGMELMRGNHVLYPKVNTLLRQWDREVKIHPHFAKQAGIFGPEAIEWILGYVPVTTRQRTDQLYCVLTFFTGMRAEDCDNTLCKHIEYKKPALNKKEMIPREYLITLETTKNDRDGTGTV